MEMKLLELKLYKYSNMNVLNFKDFMKKYKLKKDTMNESQLQKI